MKNRSQKTAALISMVCLLVLGGCFSNDDDDGGGTTTQPPGPVVTPTEVPDSAAGSATAFFNFIAFLNATDDGSEPLTIKENFVAPVDDTGEPMSLT